MDYYTQKAKKMYELFMSAQPCKKVYAAIQKDDKYIVFKNSAERKYKYSIAGGGVEDDENNATAIKREIFEEMNINVDIIKSLGVVEWIRTWKYEDKVFDVLYNVEIFLTKYINSVNNKKHGIDGEFKENEIIITEISKKELLENVYEFKQIGLTF